MSPAPEPVNPEPVDPEPVDPEPVDPEPVSPERANPTEVDARGLRCPLPVIRLAEAARDAPAGTRIVVLASDPAARHDIPAWCRMRDHELREVTGAPTEGEHPAYLRFEVVIRACASRW